MLCSIFKPVAFLAAVVDASEMSTGSKSRLLTQAEVAKLLRVDRSSVSRWTKAGILPDSVRVGPRTIRYEREAIENWLRSGGVPEEDGDE